MALLGDYEVIGPNGEYYGRYKEYPPKEKIPLYAMVKKVGGSTFQFGEEAMTVGEDLFGVEEESMFGLGQEGKDAAGLAIGLGAGALILGAILYNIVTRMPKAVPALVPALGAMTAAARKYIHKKVRILRHEGYPQRQAVAVAHAMARKRGFRSVPRRPRRR